jgi:hypothetical protein
VHLEASASVWDGSQVEIYRCCSLYGRSQPASCRRWLACRDSGDLDLIEDAIDLLAEEALGTQGRAEGSICIRADDRPTSFRSVQNVYYLTK